MALVKEVYLATKTFPREEVYGLTSQIRRSAISVPSNIAEGQGRLSGKEFKQFLAVARGSLLELETQVLLGQDLNFMSDDATSQLTARTQEVLRMLNGLIKSLPH